MFRWYVITHNLHAFQMVIDRCKVLGVEIYSPTKIELKKRRDCNGVRATETQLFPGYLFVRIDPEIVHTSTVSDIPGVKGFVQFGNQISTVSASLIEALKHSLLLQTDQKVTSLEYRNVQPDTMAALSAIALMKTKLERQTAFFALLQQDAQIIKMANRPFSRICTVTERLPVNDKVG